VQHLGEPVDRDLRQALQRDVSAAVVISRDDTVVLRTALLIEYLKPGIRLIGTIFDRTVARQVVDAIPNCHIQSMADAAIGALSGPCIDPQFVALHHGEHLIGIRPSEQGFERVPVEHPAPGRLKRAWRRLTAQFRPHDQASRLLLLSLGGLVLLAAAKTLISVARGVSVVDSIYGAFKSLATIAPEPTVEHGPAWLKLFESFSTAAALVLLAVFTAALVNRLLSGRLTGIVGSRTIPRADHVVVVGLGQVGLRLCLELRTLGIDVVAVEQNPEAPYLPLARRLKVPVVIGRGWDRFVLERLSLSRARALAAVTSDELANIAVSVSALAVEPRVRTVLRAGGNEVTRETQALFPVGVAQDVQRIAATSLAATALGHDLEQAFMHDGRAYIQLPDGSIEPFPERTAT
jgi:TrkA-N domain